MLSILCVTRVEPFTHSFLHDMSQLSERLHAEFVVGVDRPLTAFLPPFAKIVKVENTGPSLEGVLDKCLSYCSGDFVLRLDDDERCSSAMVKWLEEREYEMKNHWSFPRVHLWSDKETALINPPLWPDPQTRLSLRSFAGGRTSLHSGSPFGFGANAPVAIEHHKFLVRSYAERKAIVERYDAFHKGFGSGVFLPYSLPEDAYTDFKLIPYDEVTHDLLFSTGP